MQKKGLNIYGSKLQKLPTPHYIVLYNGETNAPDRQTLHLSDAFEKPGGCVEMSAEMYNINYGHNQDLMEQCRPLHDYSILVDKIRRYRKSGAMVREAVDRAVEECIREDVLAEFLKEHKAEVIGMLLTEPCEAGRNRRRDDEYPCGFHQEFNEDAGAFDRESVQCTGDSCGGAPDVCRPHQASGNVRCMTSG